jgi:hypothetical protein
MPHWFSCIILTPNRVHIAHTKKIEAAHRKQRGMRARNSTPKINHSTTIFTISRKKTSIQYNPLIIFATAFF